MLARGRQDAPGAWSGQAPDAVGRQLERGVRPHCLGTTWLVSRLDPPGRIPAALTSPVQADFVVCGISQPGLAPKPGLVFQVLRERVPDCLERRDLCVEVSALKVDDGLIAKRKVLDQVHRERRITIRALKARIVRRADDELQTEADIEAHRLRYVCCRHSDLVESHDGCKGGVCAA